MFPVVAIREAVMSLLKRSLLAAGVAVTLTAAGVLTAVAAPDEPQASELPTAARAPGERAPPGGRRARGQLHQRRGRRRLPAGHRPRRRVARVPRLGGA